MPHERPAKLPHSIQEIADVIGREKALEFIDKLPAAGRRPWRVCVYIPKRLPADHKLVRMLGWHDASKLCRAFSGMILQPANGRRIYHPYRNSQIARMDAEGIPHTEIAETMDLSVYRVREILTDEQKPEKGAKNG